MTLAMRFLVVVSVVVMLLLATAVAVVAETVRSDPQLRTGSISCGSGSWSVVGLDVTYASMVVVASPRYAAGDPPVVVRVRNASGSSFQVMVQNPCLGASLSGVMVDYIVLEAGVYSEAVDGVKAEAVRVVSSSVDSAGSWVGSAVSYSNTYDSPVVLGQVMTTNDAWSTFWCRGGSASSPPDASVLYVGKHVGEAPNTLRLDEVLGYLVIEEGSGVFGGLGYVAALGPDTVVGTDSGSPTFYSFAATMSSVSGVVVGLAGMDGNDGGWAVATSVSDSGVELIVEEDQCADSEREHGTEQVGYIALGEIAVPAEPNIRVGSAICESGVWLPIILDRSYDSMVVLASAHYSSGVDPAVARVRNATGNGFEVMVQNPCHGTNLENIQVDYLVIEEGVFSLAANGLKAEAVKLTSTTTDFAGGWTGELRSYSNTYDMPVVLGQVMSGNDAAWSEFWCYDGTQVGQPPSPSGLAVGKHAGEDAAPGRLDEDLGYLVIEAGPGTVDGLVYTAGVGGDTVTGPDNGSPAQYPLAGFFDQLSTVLVNLNGMDGDEGAWAVSTARSTDAISLIADEDQCADTERAHTTEQVAYLVFGTPGLVVFADDFEDGFMTSWSSVVP